MEGFILQLFFPSQRESRSSVPNMIFGPLPYGGAYKIAVLYVSPSVFWNLYQKWIVNFF